MTRKDLMTHTNKVELYASKTTNEETCIKLGLPAAVYNRTKYAFQWQCLYKQSDHRKSCDILQVKQDKVILSYKHAAQIDFY